MVICGYIHASHREKRELKAFNKLLEIAQDFRSLLEKEDISTDDVESLAYTVSEIQILSLVGLLTLKKDAKRSSKCTS